MARRGASVICGMDWALIIDVQNDTCDKVRCLDYWIGFVTVLQSLLRHMQSINNKSRKDSKCVGFRSHEFHAQTLRSNAMRLCH